MQDAAALSEFSSAHLVPQSLIRLNGTVMPLYDPPLKDVVPSPRAAPGGGLTLEEVVARIADLVLKATSLAERYERSLHRLTEPAEVAAQQARVQGLRSWAERGRLRLIDIGGRG